jgi:hypothetical protein
VDWCVSSPPGTPLYIVGRGAPYRSTKAPRAAAKEEEGGGQGNPNPSRPGRGFGPPFFLLSYFPNGFLSLNQRI